MERTAVREKARTSGIGSYEAAYLARCGKARFFSDRADGSDLIADDIEGYHSDEPLLCVKPERSWAFVNLDGAQRHARDVRAEHD